MQRYQLRPKYDPFSNTYNSGRKNHPNFPWKEKNNPSFSQKRMQGLNISQSFPPKLVEVTRLKIIRGLVP